MRILAPALFLACLVASPPGCSDESGSPDAADGTDAGKDDGQGGTDDDTEVKCAYGQDFVVQFDKSCKGDEDCDIAFGGANCCGTLMAVGLAKTDKERFETNWAVCADKLERCRCPVGPTEVEDGTTTTDPKAVAVRCKEGQCLTYLP